MNKLLWEDYSELDRRMQDGVATGLLEWLRAGKVFKYEDLLIAREALIMLQKADNPTRHTAWFHVNAMIRGMQDV